MVEREIICCGARGWVKTIAWIQIISNCIEAAACLIVMLFVLIPQNFNKYYVYDKYPPLITLACFNFAVVGIVCGVFLLLGTNQNNTKYIKRWMIYQVASLILYGNVVLAGPVLGLWELLIFIIPLLYTVYGIWIVCVFVVEIQPPSNEGSGQQGLLAQPMNSRREGNSQPESGPPPPYNPKMTQQV